MSKKVGNPACQFCGNEAVNLRYKPSKDYPMAYDLCERCAKEHKEAWLRVQGK